MSTCVGRRRKDALALRCMSAFFVVAKLPAEKGDTRSAMRRRSLDGGSLDDGLALFHDRLVGAKDGLPDDRAEDTAEERTSPEHPDPARQGATTKRQPRASHSAANDEDGTFVRWSNSKKLLTVSFANKKM